MQLAVPIEWLPFAGTPEQLILLLHGGSADGRAMAPLAQLLRDAFPQAAVVAPDAPEPAPEGGTTRRWFDPHADPAQAVGGVLPALEQWVRRMQQQHGVSAQATALGGFSQGASLALATAFTHDGLAGRVLAFSGRLCAPPSRAPRETTVHLFHGGADTVVPAEHSRRALQLLDSLRGDATLDIAEGIGHALHPALLQRALFRLRNHIPARTWAQALGAAPAA